MTSQLITGYRVHFVFIDKQGTIPIKDGDSLESEKNRGFPNFMIKYIGLYTRNIFFGTRNEFMMIFCTRSKCLKRFRSHSFNILKNH